MTILGSLRFRTAAAYMLLVLAAIAGLGFYVLGQVEDDFRSNIEDDLLSQAQFSKTDDASGDSGWPIRGFGGQIVNILCLAHGLQRLRPILSVGPTAL